MMYLNEKQFINEVQAGELKQIIFFDRERENYNDINGNFRSISVQKKEEFPKLLEDLKTFIDAYQGKTFTVRAAPYKNGRNFKLYKVQFGGNQNAETFNNLPAEEVEPSAEIREKLERLEQYENRDGQRQNVLNLFVDQLFNKIAGHIENVFINNVNLEPMNGQTPINGNQDEQTAAALEKILEILGAETVQKVAAKMASNPTYYKMMLKGFIN